MSCFEVSDIAINDFAEDFVLKSLRASPFMRSFLTLWWGGNLTFSRCLCVGNLTLASMKMSNSPGSAPHPTLGFDRCTRSLVTNNQMTNGS